MSRVTLRSLAVVCFVALSFSASPAAAEQATLQVRNGLKYTGELVEYVPGGHVTLAVAPGKTLRFAAGDLVSFDIVAAPVTPKAQAPVSGPTPTPAPAAPQMKPNPKPVDTKPQPSAAGAAPRKAADAHPPRAADSGDAAHGPSALVRAAAINALLDERADWQARDTNLAAPVLFTLVGVIATSIGIGLQVAYQNGGGKHRELNSASLMTFVTGGLVLGSGFALWVGRTSDAHRTQELERIDQQLEDYGLEAKLSPWVQPSLGSTRALAAGLDLRVTM